MAALAAWDLSHSYNVVELYTYVGTSACSGCCRCVCGMEGALTIVEVGAVMHLLPPCCHSRGEFFPAPCLLSCFADRYGEPRVGNAAFAAALSASVTAWRVTHNSDIVPHVPFEDLGYVALSPAITPYHCCCSYFFPLYIGLIP